MNDAFTIRALGPTAAEILLYGRIGEDIFGTDESVTSRQVAEQLRAMGNLRAINVRINSPGGSVFHAAAIHNVLKSHPAKVTVDIDGAALSGASLVAMAGDEIRIASNGFLMMHSARFASRGGTSDSMRKDADLLDRLTESMVGIYAARSKQTTEQVTAWLAAETWFDSKEALAAGLADKITGKLSVAADFDLSNFTNVPPNFRERKTMPETLQAATIGELKAACPGADAEFLMQQLEANATVSAAQTAFIAVQNHRLAAKKKPGVPVLAAGSGPVVSYDGNDPIAQWNEIVAENKKTMPPARAVRKAAHEHPGLRESMVAAYNAQAGRVAE